VTRVTGSYFDQFGSVDILGSRLLKHPAQQVEAH